MAEMEQHKEDIERAVKRAKEDGYVVQVDTEEGTIELSASMWRYDLYRDERVEFIYGVEFI